MSDIEVQVATQEDVDLAIEALLIDAELTLDELSEQAKSDRFTSERARIAWFVLSPFLLAREDAASSKRWKQREEEK